jgi:hypothetical protein
MHKKMAKKNHAAHHASARHHGNQHASAHHRGNQQASAHHRGNQYSSARHYGTRAMGAGPASPSTDMNARSRQARMDQAYADWRARR